MTAARWMVCVVLGAMVCVVAGWRLTSILFSMPGVGTGQLQFEPRSVNMGFVCPGEQRTFRVRVLNVGNGPLELGEVDASCGCTDLQLTARSVAPGGETVLTGKLRLSMKEEVFNHVVWIMDAQGKDRLGQFFLRGRAAWPVQASSELIQLGDLRPGSPATADLQIYSPHRAQFRIKSIETSVPYIRVVRQDALKNRVHLTIEVEPPTTGEIDEAITIRTSHPKRPVLMIAVKGTVRGEVWLGCNPTFFLGLRRPGERVERAVIVRCTKPELGQVTGVALEGEGWELADWRYTAGQGTTTGVLQLALIVPRQTGRCSCKVRLETAAGTPLFAEASSIGSDGEGKP